MFQLNHVCFVLIVLLGATLQAADTTNRTDVATPAHALSPEKRMEMVNRMLASMKTKNPELYKELVALREKDPEAFRVRIRELHQKQMRERGGLDKADMEAQMSRALEKIKDKDPAAYLELLDLKEKDPAQFRVKFHEYMKHYAASGEKTSKKGQKKSP